MTTALLLPVAALLMPRLDLSSGVDCTCVIVSRAAFLERERAKNASIMGEALDCALALAAAILLGFLLEVACMMALLALVDRTVYDVVLRLVVPGTGGST